MVPAQCDSGSATAERRELLVGLIGRAGIRYTGSLSREHLRAVVRVAATAHRLELTVPELAEEMALLTDRGSAALAAFTARSARFAETVDRLGLVDPALAERLVLLFGLGWRQSELLDGARGVSPSKEATLLSAAFNAAITIYDRLIDEHPESNAHVHVPGELVDAVFVEPSQTAAGLERAVAAADEPRLAVYLALMAECARIGDLMRVHGDPAAWDHLGVLVRRLYTVEVGASARLPADAALPTLVTMTIGELGHGGIGSGAGDLAEAFGVVLAVVDDVVDLLDDINAVRGSSLLTGAANAGRTVCDADLYDAIASGMAMVSAAVSRIRDGGSGRGSAAGLARFARAMVMAWTGLDGLGGITRPADAPAGTDPLDRGVRALLAAQAAGYEEATHWLRLPRMDWSYETHAAVVAQRAVVDTALLDARDAGAIVPRAVLAEDMLGLLRAKHRGVRGGWNYVPSVPELPPDADDLGQVTQALARYSDRDGPALVESAEEPARMLLDSAGEDGGVLTWVVDPRGRSAADAAVRAYLPVMGGWGRHTEVVANFALGLHRADAVRYSAALNRIAGFLVARQEDDGSWASSWYTGPYYGTYKALAALATRSSRHPALWRGCEFLRARQDEGGAWALPGADADALSTALALAGLAAASRAEDEVAVRAGRAALVARQRSDGTWPAVPWISFATMAGGETFASSTITTAYAVSALAATARLLGPFDAAR